MISLTLITGAFCFFLAVCGLIDCFAQDRQVIPIPSEYYPREAAEYVLKDQIGAARVLRGELTMDKETGTASIRADIITPGGLVYEIDTPVNPKGVNPRKKVRR